MLMRNLTDPVQARGHRKENAFGVKSLFTRLSFILGSRQSRSKKVSCTCQKWLQEVGINFGGAVYEVTSSRYKHQYLLILHMQGVASFEPAELLGIRLFLTEKLASEMCLDRRAFKLILSIFNEPRSLPIPLSSLTKDWLRNFVVLRKASPTLGANVRAIQSRIPDNATRLERSVPLAPRGAALGVANPIKSPSGGLGVAASAHKPLPSKANAVTIERPTKPYSQEVPNDGPIMFRDQTLELAELDAEITALGMLSEHDYVVTDGTLTDFQQLCV